MATKIDSGQTVLFIGDSITDCGRRGGERPLGNGYVKLFTDMLIANEPDKKVTIINKGISGDRVTGLRERWTDDVVRHQPDWLSIKIGINDLHRHLAGTPEGVPPELYREAYARILERTRSEVPHCQILLIDPFYLSTERSANTARRAVLDLLPQYLEIVHQLSQQFGTRLVRTHEIFQNLLTHYESDTFCPEPVHPNSTGHFVIATAVYRALSE